MQSDLVLTSNYMRSFKYSDKTPMDFLVLKLNSDLFEGIFQNKDYGAMIASLDPAIIKGYVKEYNMENIIRAQRNAIIGLGNFLKNLAKDSILQIRPFKTYKYGLAYNTKVSFLDYFPDMNDPENPIQYFTLDGRSSKSLKTFKEDYKKMLGGLLVDHQSFLISEVDENGNLIKHIGAFNLIEGVLSESYFQYFSDQKDYVLAPIISDGAFDEITMEQLHLVMNQFYIDHAIISHERIKNNEYLLWMAICTALSFINFAF